MPNWLQISLIHHKNGFWRGGKYPAQNGSSAIPVPKDGRKTKNGAPDLRGAARRFHNPASARSGQDYSRPSVAAPASSSASLPPRKSSPAASSAAANSAASGSSSTGAGAGISVSNWMLR